MSAAQRRRICLAVLGAVAMALVVVVASADGPDVVSGQLGGDYASFHAAGEIVRGDPGLDADAFYDPERQAAVQEPYRPDDGGQLYFAYPAFFVAPYALVSALGFTAGYLAHTALMAVAVAVALHLLRPCNRIARDYPLEAFTVSVTFFPLFRGVTGGQNTALTLLLTALIWRMLHDDREVVAGVALGLVLFKPPFALPFLGVFLLTRRWRALASTAGTGAALYALGAVLTDPSWPAAWVDAIRFLDEFDTPFNVHNFVSLPGVAEAVFGIDSVAATVVGYGLASVVAVAVAALWLRGGGARSAVPIDLLVVATALAGVLVSPHALYYDAGLLVLAGLVIADRAENARLLLIAGWLGGLVHFVAESLGASPLVLVVVAAEVVVIGLALGSNSPTAAAGRSLPTPGAHRTS